MFNSNFNFNFNLLLYFTVFILIILVFVPPSIFYLNFIFIFVIYSGITSFFYAIIRSTFLFFHIFTSLPSRFCPFLTLVFSASYESTPKSTPVYELFLTSPLWLPLLLTFSLPLSTLVSIPLLSISLVRCLTFITSVHSLIEASVETLNFLGLVLPITIQLIVFLNFTIIF